jgi:putative endonuclease
MKTVSKNFARRSKWWVYIVQCRDGTYYTGSTNNIEDRVKLHNKGHGAKYLRGRLPVKLVYTKEYRYYKNALSAERRIKGLTRQQKSKLVRIYAENEHKIAE